MKNISVPDPENLSDASLVELSLAGDHEAFGRIVTRYQSPICALAYSACGDVARSHDLAQEIFITAWRKLTSLREPARFKAWLYGIARNLIHNTFRQNRRNPVALAESLADAPEPTAVTHEPDAQAISKEEEAILWRVLAGLPEIYREPMVLFYRQNESIQRVADVLAISEEAVRQRLSRGRALLNERVTKVIEQGLRRTGPADTFAAAVIAALPALASVTTTKGTSSAWRLPKAPPARPPGWWECSRACSFSRVWWRCRPRWAVTLDISWGRMLAAPRSSAGRRQNSGESSAPAWYWQGPALACSGRVSA